MTFFNSCPSKNNNVGKGAPFPVSRMVMKIDLYVTDTNLAAVAYMYYGVNLSTS